MRIGVHLFYVAAANYYTVNRDINCGQSLDIMFVQDTTGSFDDDLPQIISQLPAVTEAILSQYRGSRFGVAEFRDKPYYPLGEPDDFCYKLNQGQLTENMDDFMWAYTGLVASGGGDLPEASYQALINVAKDPAVGWDQRPGHSRVVILNTDAVPHLPGDMEKFDPETYPEVPHNLPPNSGGISSGDVNYECLFQDYPSPEQVKAALHEAEIQVLIFTPEDPAVTPAWRWVNDVLLEQPPAFYSYINNDSSNFAEKIISVINSIAPECPMTNPVSRSSTAGAATAPIAGTGMSEDASTSSTTAAEGAVSTFSTFTASESEMNTCVCPQPCPPPCFNPCCDKSVIIMLKHKPLHFHMEVQN
eukprot:Gregarina_sp_Poly_1__5523@NODE_2915_length_1556_cov_1173_206850_g1840_i0_p1_GENE_NODE_2915_length_1556_cov_1173_206850_g1840_i0NODE_2915_length_1556_cov_1173_206850_g1840_i0_p1_ORF_typecomplete_len360_score54_29Integrin_beta/PF00362_18/1_4e27VWA/PF00092_28/6e06VWA/PF00092_28/9e02VWA_2/PF13519_6/5_4e05VWA_2/PF13519_6/1_5e04_NODE_2915_length_1556_cov_1173_206850_g1840_i02171296